MPKFGSNINDNGEKEYIIEGEIPTAFEENYNSFFEKFQIQSIKSDDELSYENYVNKKERVCIFCGLSYPDTTFKNDAHLIPQCLGNKKLLSFFECDECNAHFSKYENDISNYIGYKRIPSSAQNKMFAPPGKRFKLKKADGGGLNLDTINSINLITNSMNEVPKLLFRTHSYSPLNIWKLLVKIAVSLMNDTDRKKYTGLITYLFNDCVYMRDTHYKEVYTVYVTKINTNVNMPVAILYKKKDTSTRSFTHTFQIYFYDELWQIFLPMHDDDDVLYDGVNAIVNHYCPPTLVETDLLDQLKENDKPLTINSFYANKKAKTYRTQEIKVSAAALLHSDKIKLYMKEKDLTKNVYSFMPMQLVRKDDKADNNF